jgi:DNA gyrase subunit A
MAIKFDEINARPLGRVSRGMRGMRLKEGDEVIGMIACEDEDNILTITRNGFGKRTRVEDYRFVNRGGKGVINLKVSDKTGEVVAIRNVTDEDSIMFVTQNGLIIRIKARDVSTYGRQAQGLRLMRLNEGDKVISTATILAEEDSDDVETAEIPEQDPKELEELNQKGAEDTEEDPDDDSEEIDDDADDSDEELEN